MKTKKALSILTTFIVLLSILFTLTTCKKKTEDNPTTNDAFLISPKAKFIVNDDWQSMIQSIDSTNYTLTFDKGLLSKYSLSQGDLMVSSVGNGLLRKIDTITQSGNNVQIQTSQATLTDLIQQGDIDFRSSLLTSGIKSIKYYYPGVHLDTANLKSTNGKLFSLDINTEIAPLILLSGNFQCTQDFIFQIQIGLWDGLKKVKFGFEGTQAFDLKLTAGKEFTLNKEVTLATVYFIPFFITIPVFPFEIPVVPVFDIKLGLDGSAVATISTSLSQNLTLGTGIQYLKGEGWSKYKTAEKSINYTPPELTMNAAAEAYIKPELRMLLFNVVGPYMNGKGYGKIDADVAKTPWWKMFYGFTVSAGAKATILGKELFDYHVDDLLSWEQLVGQASGTSSDSVPNVLTKSVTNITNTTSTSGGNVTSQGSSAVTARGVCWSTSPSPTISNSYYTTDGSGTGSFTSNLIGLSPGTPYYVRAYATNSIGTGYGSQVNFSTTNGSDPVPTVTTNAITNITQTSATCGGNVTSQGSSSVTARGVCWSVSSNPTTSDSHTTDGSGTGSFTSNITGLTTNTLYYVRAYATNSAGTSYGNNGSFTATGSSAGVPCPGMPTITDSRDGQVYPTVQFGSQCWLQKNMNYNTGNSICYDSNSSNCNTYGRLYDWQTALGVCPSGWHLPSDAEWQSSISSIGINTVVGGMMKEAGTTHWESPNTGATNSTGFTALPGGGFFLWDNFQNLGTGGMFWSSHEFSSLNGATWYVNSNTATVTETTSDKTYKISVRCVHD